MICADLAEHGFWKNFQPLTRDGRLRLKILTLFWTAVILQARLSLPNGRETCAAGPPSTPAALIMLMQNEREIFYRSGVP